MNQSVHFTPAMARHRRFVVWQNPRGQWVAREGAGLIGGVFRSQRDAVRFALFETGSPDFVVVIGGGARARATG
jgi:hypothetical protein